jgi:uncharacterized membrane protein YgcG
MKSTMAVFAVAVLSIALTVSSSFVAAQSAAKPEAQPHMTDALAHLQEAQKALESASHDKGGHRAKALTHVKQSIAEVQEGIRFDNAH